MRSKPAANSGFALWRGTCEYEQLCIYKLCAGRQCSVSNPPQRQAANRYHFAFALMAFGVLMYFMNWSYFIPSQARHSASGWVNGVSVFLIGAALMAFEEIGKFWNGNKEK